MCLLTHINYLMLTKGVPIVNVANIGSKLGNAKQAAEYRRATGAKYHANHRPLVQFISDIVHKNHPVIIKGPIIRYLIFSVLTLLLFTACGGTDLDRLIKTRECVKCDLSGANLRWANLTGANLNEANLYEANLTGANLTGANLGGADLIGAYLTGAYLTGANLYEANLTGADLTGAYLGGADLTGTDLIGAYLTGADLTGANLTGTYLNGADLTGAILDDVIGADFDNALNVAPEYLKD
jgi:hypothetical protein